MLIVGFIGELIYLGFVYILGMFSDYFLEKENGFIFRNDFN